MQFVRIRALCCKSKKNAREMVKGTSSSTTCLTKEGIAVALRSIGLESDRQVTVGSSRRGLDGRTYLLITSHTIGLSIVIPQLV